MYLPNEPYDFPEQNGSICDYGRECRVLGLEPDVVRIEVKRLTVASSSIKATTISPFLR